MLQDFLIIAPQTVDALDVEQVFRLQLPHQLFVLWAVKVFAGLLVQKDVFIWHRHFPQAGELPVLILFPRTDPNIAIRIGRHGIPPVLCFSQRLFGMGLSEKTIVLRSVRLGEGGAAPPQARPGVGSYEPTPGFYLSLLGFCS